MAHCPGCGADLWRTGGTFGHILGCGVLPSDPGRIEDQQCPWPKEVQLRILAEALEQAFGARQPRDRAEGLARALQDRLSYVANLSFEERERYASRTEKWQSGDREEILQELNRLSERLEELRKQL